MSIPRRKIESSLKKKGFVQGPGDHRYYYHEVGGKRTGAYTFVSTGSKYKTYDISLLKPMKMQLNLDNLIQVRNLLECPMDLEEYNRIIKSKGLY